MWTAAVDAKEVEASVHGKLKQLFKQDIPERASTKLGPSQEDLQAEEILKDGIRKVEDVPACAPSEDAPKMIVNAVSNVCKEGGGELRRTRVNCC